MDHPTYRLINDVDFTTDKFPGNENFRSTIQRLVQDGSYNPTLGTPAKNQIVRHIQNNMTSLNPPGRFLKNSQGVVIRLLNQQEIQQKIWKTLEREWKNKNITFSTAHQAPLSSNSSSSNNNNFRSMMDGFQNTWNSKAIGNLQKQWEKKMEKHVLFKNVNDVDFTSTRNDGNDNFDLLARTLIEDGSYQKNMHQTTKNELVDRIQGYFASLDPPGRFLKQLVMQGISSNVQKVYEKLSPQEVRWKINNALHIQLQHKNHMDVAKVRDLWNDYVYTKNKKLLSEEEEKTANANANDNGTEAHSMESVRRYQNGTKLQISLRAEVVGYNTPNYRIRYVDKHREQWNEEDLQRFVVPVSIDASSIPPRRDIPGPANRLLTREKDQNDRCSHYATVLEQLPQPNRRSSGTCNDDKNVSDQVENHPHHTHTHTHHGAGARDETDNIKQEFDDPHSGPQFTTNSSTHRVRHREDDHDNSNRCDCDDEERPRKKKATDIKVKVKSETGTEAESNGPINSGRGHSARGFFEPVAIKMEENDHDDNNGCEANGPENSSRNNIGLFEHAAIKKEEES